MTIGYVQDVGLVSSGSMTNTSTTPNFGSLPTPGNHVIAMVGTWANLSDVIGYSDNQTGANTWAADKQGSASVGQQGCGIGSAKIVSASGTYTVTVTDTNVPSTKYWEWTAVEFSGLASSSHLDQTGNADVGTGATSLTVNGSGANAQASELVVAVMSNSGSGGTAGISDPPSGYDGTNHWVQQNAQATVAFQGSFKVVSGVETSQAVWTFNSTSGEGANGIIASYKAAAGGGSAIKARRSSAPRVGTRSVSIEPRTHAGTGLSRAAVVGSLIMRGLEWLRARKNAGIKQ